MDAELRCCCHPDIFPSQEEIARDVCFRLSFVEKEYEGMVTNACDVADALGRDAEKFRELKHGTSEFYGVAKHLGSAPIVDRDGVRLLLDRVWGIAGQEANRSNSATCFFSTPSTEDLISIADEGFCSQDEGRAGQRYIRVIDTCQVAMLRTSDELSTCLVVDVNLDPGKRVFVPSEGEGHCPLGAFARSGCESAHYYDSELRGCVRLVPQNRVAPLYFLLFRKVRSSGLWLGISSAEFNTTELPVVDAVPVKDPSPALLFLRTLAQNTRKLWDVEARGDKAVLMKRKVFLKTEDFVCVTTAHPDFEIDFTLCPRTQRNWDTLSSGDGVEAVLTLYTFATYVKALLEKLLKTRVDVLFPLNPSEWQLHCRVVCATAAGTHSKEKKFLSVEKVVSDVAMGRLCGGYSTTPCVDTGNVLMSELTGQN